MSADSTHGIAIPLTALLHTAGGMPLEAFKRLSLVN